MNEQTPDTVALFGLPITNVTMAQAVARVEEHILSGRSHQIATANLDFARNSLKDQYLQRVICDCSMVLPDGAPMLWAATLFRTPLKERVTGVDLIPELAKLSAERGYGIYLLGASEESSLKATEVLKARYPGVKIVGRTSPQLQPLHEMDNEGLLRMIEEANPAILLVAFGNPKQEIWIHRHRDRLKVPVVIGIGGALDMIAGSLKRAPIWVQKMQLEWVLPPGPGTITIAAALYARRRRTDYAFAARTCGKPYAAVGTPAGTAEGRGAWNDPCCCHAIQIERGGMRLAVARGEGRGRRGPDDGSGYVGNRSS